MILLLLAYQNKIPPSLTIFSTILNSILFYLTNKLQKSHNEDMDQNSNLSSEEPTVYFPDPPIYKQRWVKIALFIALSPLLMVAFLWIKDQPLFQPKQSTTVPVATSSASIKEEDLPITLNILKNPAIYQWTGSIEGTLTDKDDTSLTITTKDNHSITIPLDLNPNGTKFYNNKPEKDLKAKSLTLEDIRIGSKIRGDFFIIPNKKNEIHAGSFIILEP